MKSISRTMAAGLTLLCNLSPSPAADLSASLSTSKATANPGLLNAWLQKQNDGFVAWDFGGQIRARYEVKENGGSGGAWANSDFRGSGVANDNSFLLLRERVHIGYHTSWLGAYVEAKDASSSGDSRHPNPEADQFDLHQAWIGIGNPKEFPLSLRLGRQELVYGDERLVGNGDWGNLARSFDAAKLRYETDKLWVDAFSGRPVIADNRNFNTSNDYDQFSGAYASTRSLWSHQESQIYLLARNTSAESAIAQTGSLTTLPGARDIYTIGARVKSLPGTLGGWDYSGELAGQAGSIKSGGPNTARLDHRAFAASVGGGYSFSKMTATPRVGIEYNLASGDKDPSDGRSGTFEQLFPTNHKHYGTMDFVAWKNIHDVRLASSFKPLKRLQVSLDYHLFWLATTHDSFYSEAGSRRTGSYGIHPQNGKFVGSEFDLDANYSLTSWVSLRGGYGHFITGTYVDRTLASTGGSSDADWVYLQTTLNF